MPKLIYSDFYSTRKLPVGSRTLGSYNVRKNGAMKSAKIKYTGKIFAVGRYLIL